jgi:outer membrane protein TolC
MCRAPLAIVTALACMVPAWADNPTLPMPGVARDFTAPRTGECPGSILAGPALNEAAIHLPSSQPEPRDKPLPINLAAALRLSGARPLVIDAARASLAVAAAQLEKARLLWLPSLAAGVGYYHHDGQVQGASGTLDINTKDQFMVGGGFHAGIVGTDALFAPLAARQIVRARQADVETARNEALFTTAQAYFKVQDARGHLAGTIDVIDKGRKLADKVTGLHLGQVAPTDIDRARALLADFEQTLDTERENWRIASADLTQVLRLDPTAVVVPLEPPQIMVTLVSPASPVDALIPIGLTSRPELASQRALVQAALARIRQERMRPLVPSLILEGAPGATGPGNYMMGGLFMSGAHGMGDPTGARDDISLGLFWGVENLGFGNRALVHERQAERRQMLVELFRVQDSVAADIARAHAQLISATDRLAKAENELREAQRAYQGGLEDLGKVVSVGDSKLQVSRVLDVISSIQAMARAYDNYFDIISQYNTAQFRLFRALGYPANLLACSDALSPSLTGRP